MIDMLPHDRAEYQQQMGHVWLGFPERQMRKLLRAAGFADIRIQALPIDAEAKGPALFAAVATRNGTEERRPRHDRPGNVELRSSNFEVCERSEGEPMSHCSERDARV